MPCLVAAYFFVIIIIIMIDQMNEATYEFALNIGNSHDKSFIEMFSVYE
jgi:hypothetical protein